MIDPRLLAPAGDAARSPDARGAAQRHLLRGSHCASGVMVDINDPVFVYARSDFNVIMYNTV